MRDCSKSPLVFVWLLIAPPKTAYDPEETRACFGDAADVATLQREPRVDVGFEREVIGTDRQRAELGDRLGGHLCAAKMAAWGKSEKRLRRKHVVCERTREEAWEGETDE